MNRKRLAAFLLSGAMCLSLFGCTQQGNESGTSSTTSAAENSSVQDNTSSESEKTDIQLSDRIFGQVAMGGGGFVSGVFATEEKGLYYARTDVGGAYRYDSDKGMWVSVSYDISEDDRGLLGIDGLAFGKKDPNVLYLLSGTEYFSGGMTCLLISNDYGKTFERVNLTEMITVHGNGMGRGNGERIAVDPKDSNILYIGGRKGGMLKSVDGGKTFTQLNMGTKTETSNANGICSIVVDPTSGDDKSCSTIYAAISRTNEDNIYKSTDGGETWTAVKNADKSLMVQRMKMREDGKVLITYADTEGPWNNNRVTGGIFILDGEKEEFTDISPAKKSFGDVVYDPANPDRMVACTENIYNAQPNGAYGDEFYSTTDGGKTWNYLNSVMTMSDGGIEWIKVSSMHWCSSMCIDPNDTNKVMVVSGNGIFACDNIWDASPEFYFNAKGIEETVPYELVSIKGGKLVTAIGDYDGFAQDDATKYGMVHSSTAGSMTSIAVAAQNPDVWVKCGTADGLSMWYTLDGGQKWKKVRGNPLSDMGKSANGGYVSVSCDGKTFYWAPGNDFGLYYSQDNGASWSKADGAMSAKYISCDPVNPDYVYASSSGGFHVSTDGGKTFKQNTELAVFKECRPVVTPDIEGKLYLGAMGLQVSEDHGQTFTRIENVAACLAVGLGKGKTDNDPYTIFIWGRPKDAETIGLYWSEDEGVTWERVNDDLHQFGGPGNGYFVAGDYNVYGRCYMSTVGLGVVYSDLKQ